LDKPPVISSRFASSLISLFMAQPSIQPVNEAAELIGQDAGSLYAPADVFEGFAIDKFIQLVGFDDCH
jgi:hypothetical protein